MESIFLKVLNLSILSSWVILAVILLRWIFQRTSQRLVCSLWAIAGIRLVMPFSFESRVSLVPSRETLPPEIASGGVPEIKSNIEVIDKAVNSFVSERAALGSSAGENFLADMAETASIIWLAGMGAMLLYAIVSTCRLKRKLRFAVAAGDKVMVSESVTSPFILGIIRPKIYIPYNMDQNTGTYVMAHEKAHIERRDYLIKPLAFMILSVHWFNPLVWLAYVLLCRDIELACDEKVIKQMEKEERREYSKVLLRNSVAGYRAMAFPLAFGEVGVKERIEKIMKYKKASFWVIAIAVVICIIGCVCLLTDPKTEEETPKGGSQGTEVSKQVDEEEMDRFVSDIILTHFRTEDTADYFPCENHALIDRQVTEDKAVLYLMVLYQEYDCTEGRLENVAGSHIPTVITLNIDKEGKFSLEEYWEPADGADYASDIESKFPESIRDKADTQLYVDEQLHDCVRQAEEHFNLQ